MPLSQDSETRILQLAEALARSNAAVPLTLPPDYLNRALQYLEALARKRGVLPPLPSDLPDVATITKSIGTSSRDYSTITSWEADLDNSGVYAASDIAQGECYNDSAFDEQVTINGGGTIGLVGTRLTAATGQRHDGTAGTGVRIARTGGAVFGYAITSSPGTVANLHRISWIEITYQSATVSGEAGGIRINRTAGDQKHQVDHCLIHSVITGASRRGLRAISAVTDMGCDLFDNIFYRGESVSDTNPKCAVEILGGRTACVVANNTVHNFTTNNTATIIGMACGNAGGADLKEYKNNIVTTIDSTSGSESCYSKSSSSITTPDSLSYSLSSDTSANGTGALTSKSASNQFVSIVTGSEDLHLKTGADAIDAGTDLATSPSGVEIDIDGYDRDATGATWDMGADEFVSVATGQPFAKRWGGVEFAASGSRTRGVRLWQK